MPKKKSGADKAAKSKGLDLEQVKAELLAYWDAYSPLSLPLLEIRYGQQATLDIVGIDAVEAAGFSNKYNSLITRFNPDPQLVGPKEAGSWVSKAMPWIVGEVHKRATA